MHMRLIAAGSGEIKLASPEPKTAIDIKLLTRAVHLFPIVVFGGSQDSIGHIIRCHRFAKTRRRYVGVGQSAQKICCLMDKCVFVSDLQTRHPPMLHIRMITVGDVDRAPTTKSSLVAMIEILQSVKILKVPNDRRIFSVDLESV